MPTLLEKSAAKGYRDLSTVELEVINIILYRKSRRSVQINRFKAITVLIKFKKHSYKSMGFAPLHCFERNFFFEQSSETSNNNGKIVN
jgi:hypothetical protein